MPINGTAKCNYRRTKPIYCYRYRETQLTLHETPLPYRKDPLPCRECPSQYLKTRWSESSWKPWAPWSVTRSFFFICILPLFLHESWFVLATSLYFESGLFITVTQLVVSNPVCSSQGSSLNIWISLLSVICCPSNLSCNHRTPWCVYRLRHILTTTAKTAIVL